MLKWSDANRRSCLLGEAYTLRHVRLTYSLTAFFQIRKSLRGWKTKLEMCQAYLRLNFAFLLIAAFLMFGASGAAGNPIYTAFLREGRMATGRATSWVTLEGDYRKGIRNTRFGTEVGNGAFVEVVWKGGDLWRIEVRNEANEVVRRLTCDGTRIDTGDDAFWDIRFIKQYLPRTEFPGLQLKFEQAMWPYFIVFNHHLFPISSGKQLDYESLTKLYGGVYTPKGKPGLVIAHGYRHRPRVLVLLDILPKDWHRVDPLNEFSIDYFDGTRGCMPRRYSLRYRKDDGKTSSRAYIEYEQPTEIEEYFWIPKKCSLWLDGMGEGSGVVISTLAIERSDFLCEDVSETFEIPITDGVPTISWPEWEPPDLKFWESLREFLFVLFCLLLGLTRDGGWVYPAFVVLGMLLVVVGCCFLVARRFLSRAALIGSDR